MAKNNSKEDFNTIAEKFLLTEPRYNRKLSYLSGERWRASAALGYANGKKIYYAPYMSSNFYYCMCQSGLLKVLKELAASGAIVLLPAGTDEVLKYIADECIYTNRKYDKLFLDCACEIGTQSIGIAALGYSVTASDISEGELLEV